MQNNQNKINQIGQSIVWLMAKDLRENICTLNSYNRKELTWAT